MKHWAKALSFIIILFLELRCARCARRLSSSAEKIGKDNGQTMEMTKKKVCGEMSVEKDGKDNGNEPQKNRGEYAEPVFEIQRHFLLINLESLLRVQRFAFIRLQLLACSNHAPFLNTAK